MKIAFSPGQAPTAMLESLAQCLEDAGAIGLHIDVQNVEEACEKIRMCHGFEDLKSYVHVFGSIDPASIERILEEKPDFITFQTDISLPLEELCNAARAKGIPAGWGITVAEAWNIHEKLSKELDHLLLMTTRPGVSGGTMHPETFRAIRHIKKNAPDCTLWVDGGVHAENAGVLRILGVSLAVSGSFVLNSLRPGKALRLLSGEAQGTHMHIRDFMWLPDELPVLELSPNTQALQIFEIMESGRMGFVLLVDSSGQLLGLCTGADLRRGVIKSGGYVATASVQDFFNPEPVALDVGDRLERLWEINKKGPFPYLYFPVVDRQRRLQGAVVLNHLIRSES
ncbi:MAG: hypothetical protein NZM15_09935 [Flavobacteriales bacterium]|nr:hypothetical protein [Flavobacteriales bacterium]MDW8433003.1 hypothetical protein [Flavobacteriales bacterium]